jgi:GTPase SAR1 family protein
MDTFDAVRHKILGISEDLDLLLKKIQTIPQMEGRVFSTWEELCSRIGRQISEETLRVAVVGPIKSGKSTFINSLLGGDYLKRGAGVVTSIVTRIRRGQGLKAILYFKSWDDVNADILQALTFFPAEQWRKDGVSFDIRDKQHREDLKAAIEGLGSGLVMESGSFNANCLLMLHYLEGYEAVEDKVNSENRKIVYLADEFIQQKTFVGNDALSVYLRDILLEIDSEVLRHNVEIADCQGSDSPNPLHLAMIQDYLALTHLIVYVISSRTGLREADIRFLTVIKKMGILDNILFVVNCDLNEHDALEDLNALEGRVRQELSRIKPDPQVFTFSSLYNLFKSQALLSEKNSRRLSQWEESEEFIKASIKGRDDFIKEFDRQIVQERLSLLLKNHLERLGVIASGMGRWIAVNREVLSGDLATARQFIEKIRQHEIKIGHIRLLVKDTLDGAVQKLMAELKKEVDLFFTHRRDSVLDALLEFVRTHPVNVVDYEGRLKSSGFNTALYHMFQDFKQKVDMYMAESVNPLTIKFIKEKEQRISEFLFSVASPYEGMILDAISDYNETTVKFGLSSSFLHSPGGTALPDMDLIKSLAGIKLPPMEAAMRYSAKIKTDAVMRFSFYAVMKRIKILLKKPVGNEREDALRALKDSVVLIRRETQRSILEQFKNYRENIKFQYILVLVNGASNHICQELGDRFQGYQTDLSRLTELMDVKGAGKQDSIAILKEAGEMVDEIFRRIDESRLAIERSD